ncbi:unnamed protein product [Angiostrongylus costaricensis]|uniref:Uncharacterized protein n=1 Tax=Angiostrongylus costaricensis TaxID=334426 RepID=A0A0R3PC37_ANGCS|nr:unnamed protein product [Angiostrongylus costaricensis]
MTREVCIPFPERRMPHEHREAESAEAPMQRPNRVPTSSDLPNAMLARGAAALRAQVALRCQWSWVSSIYRRQQARPLV